MGTSTTITTPIGEIKYASVTGEGKKFSPTAEPKHIVIMVFEKEQEEKLKAEIDKFWTDNKPKKTSVAKSCIYRVDNEDSGEIDEDGETIWVPSDRLCFTFYASVWWKSKGGKEPQRNIIPIFDRQGEPFELGEAAIGKGTKARIQAYLSIYESGKDVGISGYVNKIQIAKFVPFTSGFDPLEDEEPDDEIAF